VGLSSFESKKKKKNNGDGFALVPGIDFLFYLFVCFSKLGCIQVLQYFVVGRIHLTKKEKKRKTEIRFVLFV